MQPFEENHQRLAERTSPKRRTGVIILAVLAIIAVIALLVVLHLAGATPTHGR